MYCDMDEGTALAVTEKLRAKGLGGVWTKSDVAACLHELGRPAVFVTVCRPQLPWTQKPVAERARTGDDRRVTRVRSVAFLKVMEELRRAETIPPDSEWTSHDGARETRCGELGTARPMYDRLATIRPGMSVAQAMSRGVTRRDLRIAQRRGWMEIEA